MTASQLRSDLNAATGVLVSTDTIRRRLHKKGLYTRRPIICVPLTRPQKRARKPWCRQHVAWNPDEWRRVMFTDESIFSLNSDSRGVFVWREKGTRNNPRNMVERDPYRSQGFMVWAGIFLGGRTALHIFRQGTLTGQRYRDEILAAYVMPQALEMGENFLLMDDNARPHRTGVVDTFLQNHAIARMNWPARSPDLNPIEHCTSDDDEKRLPFNVIEVLERRRNKMGRYQETNPLKKKKLTPNYFLRGSNDAGPAIPSKINATDNNLRNKRKRAQILTDRFWIKWTRSYISKLATRSKWRERTEPIRIGDLVFLVDEQHPRNMWKRGFISDVRMAWKR
ncbi:hypothetical protein LAZ67_12001690 [Cordylochernes scorpioides]|uniref:Transposase n=1 Tax=Cordylochernes scorpioides TaxID=51811 RepID=A0ABY6L1Q0_9ARAC|nr:hypothetical protein LAZ67_12001690 [Cordylochernes scorpioides]